MSKIIDYNTEARKKLKAGVYGWFGQLLLRWGQKEEQ